MRIKQDIRIQILAHAILMLLTLLTVIPIILLIVSSLTSENYIMQHGYSLIMKSFSLRAYQYLTAQNTQIFNAYKITIIVTVLGTAGNLIFTSLMAYPLSRKDLPGHNIFNFYVFFTMLFNGGLVPTYLMYTEYFHMKNTILSLVVPNLLMSAWYILLMKAFFANSVPTAVIESAQIDGANEFVIYARIVMPMGKVIVATVGLFVGIEYWNDWYNGMIYLTNPNLFSIQNVMYRMISDIQFLSDNAQMAGHVDEMAASIPSTTVRMAIAVVGILPILIVYPFVQNNFVKGIALGSVKG